MTRRRVILIAAVLTLLTVIVSGTLIYRTEPEAVRVYHRLELGMTLDQTIAVIGRQPADRGDPTIHPNERYVVAAAGLPVEKIPFHCAVYIWVYWDDGGCRVWLNDTGKVARKELITFPRPTLFERLRQWLGL